MILPRTAASPRSTLLDLASRLPALRALAESQRKLKSISGLPVPDHETPSAMVTDRRAATETPLHTPAGIFVVHLRSDSEVSRQHLIGRVEHVKSGDSDGFVSLGDLLAFMDRHATETSNAERRALARRQAGGGRRRHPEP